MSNLKSNALHSIKWTTVQTIGTSILIVLFQLIKANLLSKEDFAILSILMIIIGLTQMLNNFGVSHAIIQKSNINSKDVSSLFFLNLFIGLVLSLLFIITSNLIVKYYNLPDAANHLKYTTLFIIISSPTGLLRALHEKNLYFRRLSIIQLIGISLLVITGSTLIYMGFGVKGVIFGYIFSEFIKNFLFYISIRQLKIPFIQFFISFKRLKKFLRFSILVFSKQILNFSARKLDEILIGGYFAPEVLGDYFFAKDSILKIVQLINSSLTRVFFPLFSKIKNNRSQVKKYYSHLIKYMSLFAFPVFIGLIIVADPLIPMVFGEKWENTTYLFQLFSIPAFFTVLTSNNATSLLYALNKPSLVLKTELFINISYFILLFITVEFGFIYLLSATILKMISKALILQYFTGKTIKMTLKGFVYALKYSFVGSLSMVIFALIFSKLLSFFQFNQFIDLSIIILLCITIYYLTLQLIYPNIKAEILNILKKE